ncbi:MAG: hypothetical protein NZM12_12960, partial [Steroidobacteraceae bacterium]|nr:hypothetical protein [Steroidobacteraceae bacterium]MDW8260497.1 hypothetical protein [Gammaproteobacteria bacterium]
GQYDLRGLNDYLQLIKSRFPAKTDATMLLEPDTQYDTVIQVMDAMRAVNVPVGNKIEQIELFPDISVGDAPEVDPQLAPRPLPSSIAPPVAAVGVRR